MTDAYTRAFENNALRRAGRSPRYVRGDRTMTPETPIGVAMMIENGEPQHDDDGNVLVRTATCGVCLRSWNDAMITSVTPVPSGRCPWEAWHGETDDDGHISREMMRSFHESRERETCQTRTARFTGQVVCIACGPGCEHYICIAEGGLS